MDADAIIDAARRLRDAHTRLDTLVLSRDWTPAHDRRHAVLTAEIQRARIALFDLLDAHSTSSGRVKTSPVAQDQLTPNMEQPNG